MNQFKESLQSFKGLSFYNYDLDAIDFESLLLTKIIKHHMKLSDEKSYGLKISEFKSFLSSTSSYKSIAEKFISSYHLEIVENINIYIENLFNDHFNHLKENDFQDEDLRFTSGVLLISPE